MITQVDLKELHISTYLLLFPQNSSLTSTVTLQWKCGQQYHVTAKVLFIGTMLSIM